MLYPAARVAAAEELVNNLSFCKMPPFISPDALLCSTLFLIPFLSDSADISLIDEPLSNTNPSDVCVSCEFNIATSCVELRIDDGVLISANTIAVGYEVAGNMYQRSELDYLIYNDPVAYANLILNGNPETYLKTVTEYKPLDS